MRIAALLLTAPQTASRQGDATSALASLLDHVDLIQPVGDAPSPHDKILPSIAHAASRAGSVRLGLDALDALPAALRPDLVLVHDGASACVPAGVIGTVIAALATSKAAIPCLPLQGALRQVLDGGVTRTIPGAGRLHLTQTPQGFDFVTLRDLCRAADGGDRVDEAELFERAGIAVTLIASAPATPALAQVPRTGTGFDVHAFGEPRPLMLCGIAVAHERGLAGHSDADVGLHALCDAIYGALAEGDIGRHFPPSEADWKDADSARFLVHAAGRIAARGGSLVNADVTLICERPKIGPHAEAMRQRLAGLLGVAIDRISVKATTTERLGFTGRGEGIACQASATILLP